MKVQELDEKIVEKGNLVRLPLLCNNVYLHAKRIADFLVSDKNKDASKFRSLVQNKISKIKNTKLESIHNCGQILDVSTSNVCYAMSNGKIRVINQNGINTTLVQMPYEDDVLYVSFNQENANFLLLLDNKGHLFIFRINGYKIDLSICMNFPPFEKMNADISVSEIKKTAANGHPVKAGWLEKNDRFFVTGHNTCIQVWNITQITNIMIVNKKEHEFDVTDRISSTCSVSLQFSHVLHKYSYLLDEDIDVQDPDFVNDLFLNTYTFSSDGKFLTVLLNNYILITSYIEIENANIHFTIMGVCSLRKELLKIRSLFHLDHFVNTNSFTSSKKSEISSIHILNTGHSSDDKDYCGIREYYLLVLHNGCCLSVFAFNRKMLSGETIKEGVQLIKETSLQSICLSNELQHENIELFVDPSECLVFLSLSYQIVPSGYKQTLSNSLFFVFEVNHKRRSSPYNAKSLTLPGNKILPLCSIRVLQTSGCVKFVKTLNVNVEDYKNEFPDSLLSSNLFLFAIAFDSGMKHLKLQSYDIPMCNLLLDAPKQKEQDHSKNLETSELPRNSREFLSSFKSERKEDGNNNNDVSREVETGSFFRMNECGSLSYISPNSSSNQELLGGIKDMEGGGSLEVLMEPMESSKEEKLSPKNPSFIYSLLQEFGVNTNPTGLPFQKDLLPLVEKINMEENKNNQEKLKALMKNRSETTMHYKYLVKANFNESSSNVGDTSIGKKREDALIESGKGEKKEKDIEQHQMKKVVPKGLEEEKEVYVSDRMEESKAEEQTLESINAKEHHNKHNKNKKVEAETGLGAHNVHIIMSTDKSSLQKLMLESEKLKNRNRNHTEDSEENQTLKSIESIRMPKEIHEMKSSEDYEEAEGTDRRNQKHYNSTNHSKEYSNERSKHKIKNVGNCDISDIINDVSMKDSRVLRKKDNGKSTTIMQNVCKSDQRSTRSKKNNKKHNMHRANEKEESKSALEEYEEVSEENKNKMNYGMNEEMMKKLLQPMVEQMKEEVTKQFCNPSFWDPYKEHFLQMQEQMCSNMMYEGFQRKIQEQLEYQVVPKISGEINKKVEEFESAQLEIQKKGMEGNDQMMLKWSEEMKRMRKEYKDMQDKVGSVSNILHDLYNEVHTNSYNKQKKTNDISEGRHKKIMNEFGIIKNHVTSSVNKLSEEVLSMFDDTMKNKLNRDLKGNIDLMLESLNQDIAELLKEWKKLGAESIDEWNEHLKEHVTDAVHQSLKDLLSGFISKETETQFTQVLIPAIRESFKLGFQAVKEELHDKLENHTDWLSKEIERKEKLMHDNYQKCSEALLKTFTIRIDGIEKEIQRRTDQLNKNMINLIEEVKEMQKKLNSNHGGVGVMSSSGISGSGEIYAEINNNSNMSRAHNSNNYINKNEKMKNSFIGKNAIVPIQKGGGEHSNIMKEPNGNTETSDMIIRGRINHLLSEQEYDQAFTLALSIDLEKNTGAFWILNLCSRFNESLFTDSSLPISQPALLGISKTLCESLTKSINLLASDAHFRVIWIRECLLQLDIDHVDLQKAKTPVFVQDMLNHVLDFDRQVQNKLMYLNEHARNKNLMYLNTRGGKSSAGGVPPDMNSLSNEIGNMLLFNERENNNKINMKALNCGSERGMLNSESSLLTQSNLLQSKQSLLTIHEIIIQIRKILTKNIKKLNEHNSKCE